MHAIAASALLAAIHPLPAQDIAYVESKSAPSSLTATDHGHAWLFNRGGGCYALIPKHVLIGNAPPHDDHYAQLKVPRIGRDPIPAEADRCAVFQDLDLAVLEVTGIANLADCGHVLVGIAHIDDLLTRNAQVSLVTASATGTVERSTLELRALSVTDSNHFWVAPVSGHDRLTAGMSGGLVLIQDQLTGFLLAVNTSVTGTTAGMAQVLRADRASLLLERLLDHPGATAGVIGACTGQAPEHPIAARPTTTAAIPTAATPTAAGANLASATCGATVLSWSSAAASSSDRPANLVSADGGSGLWKTVSAGPVSVEIRLCPARTPTISRVRLTTEGCAPGDDTALDVEVLTRTSTEQSFNSLGYGTLTPAASLEIGSGAPHYGRELQLRFVPRSGEPQTVCLGPIQVR